MKTENYRVYMSQSNKKAKRDKADKNKVWAVRVLKPRLGNKRFQYVNFVIADLIIAFH